MGNTAGMGVDRATSGRHRRMCQWDGCQNYANLRDLDTGRDFCLDCALAMLYAAQDPITEYVEFDGNEYSKALETRAPFALLGWPLPPNGVGH